MRGGVGVDLCYWFVVSLAGVALDRHRVLFLIRLARWHFLGTVGIIADLCRTPRLGSPTSTLLLLVNYHLEEVKIIVHCFNLIWFYFHYHFSISQLIQCISVSTKQKEGHSSISVSAKLFGTS